MDPQVQYLLSLRAVRERTAIVRDAAEAGNLSHFDVHEDKLNDVVDFVTSRDFGPDKFDTIPPHGRWQHFEVGNVPRVMNMLEDWKKAGCDDMELTRRLIDLFFVSVLLDAGAGDYWLYVEPRTENTYERSEGIAVASLYMFNSLAFTASKSMGIPLVDGKGLESLTTEELAEGLQASDKNPMPGVDSRAALLRSLGKSLLVHSDIFGAEGRPGTIVDYMVKSAKDSKIDVHVFWDVLQHLLIPIWPKDRTTVAGIKKLLSKRPRISAKIWTSLTVTVLHGRKKFTARLAMDRSYGRRKQLTLAQSQPNLRRAQLPRECVSPEIIGIQFCRSPSRYLVPNGRISRLKSLRIFLETAGPAYAPLAFQHPNAIDSGNQNTISTWEDLFSPNMQIPSPLYNYDSYTGPNTHVSPLEFSPPALPETEVIPPNQPNIPTTLGTYAHGVQAMPAIAGPILGSDAILARLRDKSWICMISSCAKRFTRYQDLSRHQNSTHFRLQSFFCRSPGCPRRRRGFPRKDKRDDHERKVHDVCLGGNDKETSVQ